MTFYPMGPRSSRLTFENPRKFRSQTRVVRSCCKASSQVCNKNRSVIEVQFLTFHFLTPFFGFRHTKWLLVKENNENRSDIAFWKILTRNMDHSRHLPTKNSQDINNKSMLENGHIMSNVHYFSKNFRTILTHNNLTFLPVLISQFLPMITWHFPVLI